MGSISLNGSSSGTALMSILMADDIQPGTTPSYQLCKDIYLYHPLGPKMAESPISMAQSQTREISVPDGPEDRVKKAFEDEWKAIGADDHIFNVARQARIYGVASLALLAEGIPFTEPIDYEKLPKLNIAFNVYDPLNTAGSIVLNQNADAMDFQKLSKNGVSVNGKNFHPSRTCVMFNERPIYIAYTPSAFEFTGRSVYQRALYPLTSFVQTMFTDDLVTVKAGVLVAMMEQAGSIIDNLMSKMFGQKRQMIKDAAVGNILSVGKDEKIESLNFRNMEGPYKTSRENILKNIATAADMPAKLLENETFVEGFGEGTEDAKYIAKYIERIREWMDPLYAFFTKVVQHRAWTPEFYETIKADFPDYENVSFKKAFYRWSDSFAAAWPNLLAEPPSKKVEVDKTKLEALTKLVEALMPELDQPNKARLIQWAAENFNDLKLLFTSPLELDYEALAAYEPPVPGFGGEGDKDGDKGDKDGDKGDKEDKAKADSEVREIVDDLRQVRDSMLRIMTSS